MDEFEQYRYDQARAWLEHIARLRHAVESSRQMVELFRGLAEQAKAIDYTRVRVSGGDHADHMADAIAKVDEARAQWAANYTAYVDEGRDAACRIQRLSDETERAALLGHYVDGKPWEHMCVLLSYSYQGMMDVRRRAVLHVYDYMPTEWRDPRPPAV